MSGVPTPVRQSSVSVDGRYRFRRVITLRVGTTTTLDSSTNYFRAGRPSRSEWRSTFGTPLQPTWTSRNTGTLSLGEEPVQKSLTDWIFPDKDDPSDKDLETERFSVITGVPLYSLSHRVLLVGWSGFPHLTLISFSVCLFLVLPKFFLSNPNLGLGPWS